MYISERVIILAVAPHESYPDSYGVYVLGDFASSKGVDPYACIVSGGGLGVSTAGAGDHLDGSAAVSTQTATDYGCYAARGSFAVGGAVPMNKLGPLASSGRVFSGSKNYSAMPLAFPNPSDNSLRVGPVDLYQGGDLRGMLPGVLHSPQPLISSGVFTTGIRIAAQGAYAGRDFEAITVGDPGSAATGVVFVDITGPWGV